MSIKVHGEKGRRAETQKTQPVQARSIEVMPVRRLRPYGKNARTHSRQQIQQIAESIRSFGFTNPVLISDENEIIAGHGRVEAAKLIGLQSVPTVRLSHLDAAQRRAYVLADNKLALNAGWDGEVLAIELQALIDMEFDVESTGFSLAEVDLVLEQSREASPDPKEDTEDTIPPITVSAAAVTRCGDLWHLGRHRLLCGDSRALATFNQLLQQERADLIFTDPPYNVPIDGNVCGRGRIRHREFAMGTGEMSRETFTAFLEGTLGNTAAFCSNGAIAFACMDWRHMGELLAAGQAVFSELKNLCVWNKPMAAWERSTAASTNSSSYSRLAVLSTPTPSGWGIPAATALMSGITRESTRCGTIACRSLPCTRPSSRWHSCPMRSRTAPGVARSSSIRLPGRAPR